LGSVPAKGTFNGDTPFALKFGPDLCGTETREVVLDIECRSIKRTLFLVAILFLFFICAAV
jgi:hypothetical protein